jgi:hypothetical protein
VPAAPAKVVTFRSELKSSIADFLSDADMQCPHTEESLVALAVALADHREEGKALFPRVLICDDLATVLRNLQGSSPIVIGKGVRAPGTALRALKKCAPLADSGWAIWIERHADYFDYGVFREPPGPTSIDLRQTLLDTPPSSLHALLIAQFAPGTVELISVGNAGLRIHLSGERKESISTEDAQRAVANWMAEDIADDRIRESYVSFATAVLSELLRKGHGTLIAIASSGSTKWKRSAGDAVVLAQPIDLAALLAAHSDESTSSALAELIAYVNLLAGMLNSDGITVVDTAGKILAFNWFIRTDLRSLSAREQAGGARHRAFAALKSLVSRGQMRGAFIRSSNGVDTFYEA